MSYKPWISQLCLGHSLVWFSVVQATLTGGTLYSQLVDQSFCDEWVGLDFVSHSNNCSEPVQLIEENVSSSKHVIICYASETNWITGIWSCKVFFPFVDASCLWFFRACDVGTCLSGAGSPAACRVCRLWCPVRLCARAEWTQFMGLGYGVVFQPELLVKKDLAWSSTHYYYCYYAKQGPGSGRLLLSNNQQIDRCVSH